jgi:uncharacterized integral membrane protein
MHKILITVLLTGVLVLFGMQNSDHVPVSFVIGSPAQVRLVFLLGVAAMFGFLLSYIQGLSKEIKLKREIRRLAEIYQSVLAKSPAGPGK